jgi:tetratricopeptide (TPR) repeat protein
MNADNDCHQPVNHAAILLILSFLILPVYSNTFQASWHLDDYHSILQNPGIQIQNLSVGALWQAATADPWSNGNLFRPVAMVSFALNWFWHGNALPGYHAVNILIHILSSYLLFLTTRALFRTPRLEATDSATADFIAWTAVLLWALNPIQVQAVTYIVQRMASLAALFFILGLFLFLQGRLASSIWRRRLYFGGCGLAFLLALGSKENAIIMPVALLLMEILFFRRVAYKVPSIKTIAVSLLGILILLLLTIAVLHFSWGGTWHFLSDLYAKRSFSLMERLLTEARIIWLYISLLFYPTPIRLSIEHHVPLSTSLLQPWTTLPALLGIGGLILIALIFARRRPLLSFGILFFLIGHVPESTVLPMELVFEHRNYLPSLFIFLPVAAALYDLVDRYRRRNNRRMTGFLIICGALLLTGLGTGTYIRNLAWSDERTLWQDAAEKALRSPRPLLNLAHYHYEKIGRLDIAVALSRKSLTLMEGQAPYVKALAVTNNANYHRSVGETEKALALYQQALSIDPEFVDAAYYKALTLAMMAREAEALADIERLIKKHGDSLRYLELKGLVLISLNRPEDANVIFRKALQLEPASRNALLNIGVNLHLIGHLDQAGWFLKRCRRLYPDDEMVLFCQVTNLQISGKSARAEKAVDAWIDAHGLSSMEAFLMEYGRSPLSMPLDKGPFLQLLSDRLVHRSKSLTKGLP